MKEAIAFLGDSMGHLQYILPKMQWLLYKKDTHFKIRKKIIHH